METNIKKITGIILLAAVIGGGVYTFFLKKKETQVITYSTSDAGNLRGEISVVLDSWIGYFPFRSPVFGGLMRDDGYRVKIIDDNADYPGRMNMLSRGKADLAVCTVDSYILNGGSARFPGTIITVIDESMGGDALVAWKDRCPNIERLKTGSDLRVAFTPASPSEHLLRAVGVHFDIPMFRAGTGPWRVEVDGAAMAGDKLLRREVDAAALWEPHVTEALAVPGVVKLIGSEDVKNLIVDILLANRKFAAEHPDLTALFLRNYYRTLETYAASPGQLEEHITRHTHFTGKQVKAMLKGVHWPGFGENLQWFGLAPGMTGSQPRIVESIHSTVEILVDTGSFTGNPLPDGDPFTIINSAFLRDMKGAGGFRPLSTSGKDESLARPFSPLSEEQWSSLSLVGSLRLRPITFRSGTEALDENGREQIRQLTESIRHYPNFRILVKGHTGLRGDPGANRQLSRKRAEAVKDELRSFYTMDPDRIRTTGVGSAEPLPRMGTESDREYENRLKRVEIVFLSGK